MFLFSKTTSPLFTEMDSQLNNLATRKSILFEKSGLYLSRKNILNDAVVEMNHECPLLFNCLKTALGNKITDESKLATMGTMYGMILHSRNNQVSSIQRLYTTVALRYNADNKV